MCENTVTEEKITMTVTTDETVTISRDEYRYLLQQAQRLDILADAIRDNIDDGRVYPVDSDLVMLLTGMKHYRTQREDLHRPDPAEEDDGK